jgi:hypothetical protein
MARYGYGMSVSGSQPRIVASIAPAPSGIPASTQTIILTNAGSFDATYTNVVPTFVWDNGGDLILEFNGIAWRFRNSDTNAELNNPSSDANYIPTTGWTQNGSPITITLTAA